MRKNEQILIDKKRICKVLSKVEDYEKSGCGIEHYMAVGYRQCLVEVGVTEKDPRDGHLQSQIHEKIIFKLIIAQGVKKSRCIQIIQ